MADQKHTYAYRAINDEGVTLTGDIEAESAEQARQALLGRGLMPTEVTRRDGPLKSKRFQKFFQKPVTYKQIILFSKQFRTLFNAGVSITQLLGILQTQTENPTLKAATADIAQQVSTGGTLYNAFRSHPDIFSPLYCSMIRAGEFSGSMGDVLDRLTYLLEHENKIRNDVKSALRYPKIVLITLAGAFFFLLNWVVPSFAKLFVNAKIELPWPTRMALAMNTALSDYWYLLLAAAVTILAGALLLAGELSFLYFLGFLFAAARLYDPLGVVLQNIAATFNTKLQIERMRSILEQPVQTGTENFHPDR